MAEFLHDECPTGIEQNFQIRTDIQTDLGNQNKHGNRHEFSCSVHLRFIQNVQTRQTDDAADNQCKQQRQHHNESEFLRTDGFGYHHNDEGQYMQFKVCDLLHDMSFSFTAKALYRRRKSLCCVFLND